MILSPLGHISEISNGMQMMDTKMTLLRQSNPQPACPFAHPPGNLLPLHVEWPIPHHPNVLHADAQVEPHAGSRLSPMWGQRRAQCRAQVETSAGTSLRTMQGSRLRPMHGPLPSPCRIPKIQISKCAQSRPFRWPLIVGVHFGSHMEAEGRQLLGCAGRSA